MSDPFIIYALPRSRTAWLSKFLTYGGWFCGHELAMTWRSIEDVKDFFSQPGTGSVETGVQQGHWLFRHHIPNIREVVIRRPIDEVIESVKAIDLRGVAQYDETILRRNMGYGDRVLERISQLPGVLACTFRSLDTEEGVRALWDHCIGQDFPRGWWLKMKDRNVQIDVPAMILDYHRNSDAIENFKRLAKSEIWRLARSGRLRSSN